MKSIIKRADVKVDEPGLRRAARAAAAASGERACTDAASARLVRLDEHTQAIEFTCACGEVSLIEIQPLKKP
jgi:hypothetical protein